MADRIQFRRDTKANWEQYDPVLADGELGFETDNKKIKIGDGSTEWTSLDYLSYTSDEVDAKLNALPITSVKTPSIVTPNDGSTDVHTYLETSSFETQLTYTGPHTSTTWEFTNTDDNSVVKYTKDKVRLTRCGLDGLSPSTTYTVRVKYHSNSLSSEFSEAITFTTSDAYISPSTVSITGEPDNILLTPDITVSAFSTNPVDSDTCKSMFISVRENGDILWGKTIEAPSGDVTITVPEGILSLDTTYDVYVEIRGNNLTPISIIKEFTTEAFILQDIWSIRSFTTPITGSGVTTACNDSSLLYFNTSSNGDSFIVNYNSLTTTTIPVVPYGNDITYASSCWMEGNDFFICGGYYSSGNSYRNEAFIYHADTNNYTQCANMPQGIRYHSVTYIPDIKKVVVFGGYDGNSYDTNHLHIYDVATDSWSNVTLASDVSATGRDYPILINSSFYNGLIISKGSNGYPVDVVGLDGSLIKHLSDMPDTYNYRGGRIARGKDIYLGISSDTTAHKLDVSTGNWLPLALPPSDRRNSFTSFTDNYGRQIIFDAGSNDILIYGGQ